MLPSTTIGLIGEHITVAAIISLGWKVSLAQQDYLDLVAWNPEGTEFFRIQVKTTFLRKDKDCRNPTYHFQNGSGRTKKVLGPLKYDILTHCAADRRRCHFIASHTLTKISQRYRPERFDDTTLEQDSWDKAIEDVRNFRKSRNA